MVDINPIFVIELLDVWAIDFIGRLRSSYGIKYIVFAIDYVSKWVEEIVFRTNNGKSIAAFLKLISLYLLTQW